MTDVRDKVDILLECSESPEDVAPPRLRDVVRALFAPIDVVGHLTRDQRADLYRRAAATDETSGGGRELLDSGAARK